jgi:hypothetical protein
MYHEFDVQWRGRVLEISCLLPSPCFPRPSVAIVGVYDPQGDNVTGELWGTDDALEIRALVERHAKTLPLWPASIVNELRDVAVVAPDERLRLLASATADTLERGAPRSVDHSAERLGVPDRPAEDCVMVFLQAEPTTTFAVISALGVDLVAGSVLLELRVDRAGEFFGALRLSTAELPGPSVGAAWDEVHPLVHWILLRSSRWTLIPDDSNAPGRQLWLDGAPRA